MNNLKSIITNKGNNLETLSRLFPVVLVFLRHFECIFCREALRELAIQKAAFNEKKIKVVFVHMSATSLAEKYFAQYGLSNAEHIPNPSCDLYKRFGLSKGKFSQLFGLKVWSRGFELRRSGLKTSAKQVGDSFQMPGIFVIWKNKIIDSYIHKSAADKPDYSRFLNCCTT